MSLGYLNITRIHVTYGMGLEKGDREFIGKEGEPVALAPGTIMFVENPPDLHVFVSEAKDHSSGQKVVYKVVDKFQRTLTRLMYSSSSSTPDADTALINHLKSPAALAEHAHDIVEFYAQQKDRMNQKAPLHEELWALLRDLKTSLQTQEALDYLTTCPEPQLQILVTSFNTNFHSLSIKKRVDEKLAYMFTNFIEKNQLHALSQLLKTAPSGSVRDTLSKQVDDIQKWIEVNMWYDKVTIARPTLDVIVNALNAPEWSDAAMLQVQKEVRKLKLDPSQQSWKTELENNLLKLTVGLREVRGKLTTPAADKSAFLTEFWKAWESLFLQVYEDLKKVHLSSPSFTNKMSDFASLMQRGQFHGVIKGGAKRRRSQRKRP